MRLFETMKDTKTANKQKLCNLNGFGSHKNFIIHEAY